MAQRLLDLQRFILEKIHFQPPMEELFTKMIFYYLHERMWHRSRFGLTENNVKEA